MTFEKHDFYDDSSCSTSETTGLNTEQAMFVFLPELRENFFE